MQGLWIWSPVEEAKIPYILQEKHCNIKKKQYYTKLNKDFKHGPH